MKLLYISSHSILEYDQVRLWSDIGYEVFSIGAYSNPRQPGDDKRPAMDLPYHADLDDLCREQRERHAGKSVDYPVIDWAKFDLHQGLIDWADAIIVDCYPETWIANNWGRIRDKRVIWRTIGQSGVQTETFMKRLERLQIVRYSPAEKRAFEPLGAFAGEDALIRFAKYPADWYGWTGDDPVIGNITQNMIDRGEFCGLEFWQKATEGLPARPAGPGSEKLPGGLGTLSYEAMRQYLRSIRAYLYTGTQPASYTLGLIEAMMTGTPVVSIGPQWMWMPLLFEGYELASFWTNDSGNDPSWARAHLRHLLRDEDWHRDIGPRTRQKAIDLFSPEVIGPQWLDFLGAPVAPEMVAA